MRTSCNTGIYTKVMGYRDGITHLCKAGFDALDLTLFDLKNDDCFLNAPDWASQARELKKVVEDHGMCFNQSHAPFPSVREDDEAYSRAVFPRILRAIEVAGEVGAGVCVVHPTAFRSCRMERNLDFYRSLEPYARDAGVKIALENMWGRYNGMICPNVCSIPEDLAAYADALDPRYFTVCLDLGHCTLVGQSAPDMIRALGKRITCLHVHDNDGKEDLHLPPFTCKMPWAEIAKALAEIGYEGDATLEVDFGIANIPHDLLPLATPLLSAVIRRFAETVEAAKA